MFKVSQYSLRTVILLICCTLLPANVPAEWRVLNHGDQDIDSVASIAYSLNESGYTFQIYRDSRNAIRSRFTLSKGLLEFSDGSCPTYQIDRGTPSNRSVNDADCLLEKNWAEFILGHVDGSNISSSTLLALMNGIAINFRFRLSSGDYRETKFSLQGSKRAMMATFGEDIQVIISR